METCCGYEYGQARKSFSPLGFQGPSKAHRTLQMVQCFASFRTLSPDNPIPGCSTGAHTASGARAATVKKKRELFPGLSPASRGSFALPQVYPHPGAGILTCLPFGCRPNVTSRAGRPIRRFDTEFPYPLGPTNPCPTAVHTEPFSTSVFKVLT